MRDVVIVGGGAAGLSAALLLARARRKVTLIDEGRQRNAPSAHSHGLLTRDGFSPADIVNVGATDVVRYGGEILYAGVDSISSAFDGAFEVELNDGRVIRTRAVLVATGLTDVLPELQGVSERWGVDVIHCPYCHGFELSDQPIAVVGGENRPFTLHQASLIRLWSDDVIFFPNTIELTPDEAANLNAWGVKVELGKVSQIAQCAPEGVLAVTMEDGRSFSRQAVFVGPKFVPNDKLLRALGCTLDATDWVEVDSEGRTAIDGVWAAGNVISSPAQIVNAASQGATAAISVNHYLLARDIQAAKLACLQRQT